MGHIRMGVLPATRKWRQVVAELELGAEVGAVAAAAAEAAEGNLQRAGRDPAFLQAFWLLTQIPLAARGPTFPEDLRELGMPVPDQPGLMDLSAPSASIDAATSTPGRIGQALSFDGEDDYIDGDGLITDSSARSFSFWIKAATTTSNLNIAQLDYTTGGIGRRLVTQSDGSIDLTILGTEVVYIDGSSASDVLPDLDWHHVVITTTNGTNTTNLTIGSTTNALFCRRDR